jgi:hypothetical protein
MARDTVAVDTLARLAISRISITWLTLAQSSRTGSTFHGTQFPTSIRLCIEAGDRNYDKVK